MAKTFNSEMFNVSQFNEGDVVHLHKPLTVAFSVESRLYAPLNIEFSVPLQRELDVVFSVLRGLEKPLDIEFQVGQEYSYVSRTFNVEFAVEELLEAPLDVDFSVQTQKALDIIFDVAVVRAPLNIQFSVAQAVTKELDVIFSVSDTISLESTLDIIFSVEAPTALPVSAPIEFPFGYDSIREADGYVDLIESWPPTYLDESEDDLFGPVTTFEPVSDQSYTVGAIAFDTQIYVINNECAQVKANRMLETSPSEIKDLVYEAESVHQTEYPSILNLYTRRLVTDALTIEPKLALTLSRLPADVSRLKDVEVWVSGIGPSGTVLPSYQKCLYLRYGNSPNRIVESYVGSVDEIAAFIITSSNLIDVHSPSVTLGRDITAFDITIPLKDATQLPSRGYIVFDNSEIVFYDNRDDYNLYNCQRGVWNTTASRHEKEADARSTYTYNRTVPSSSPSDIANNGDLYRLANTRRIGLINDSNSKHLALWKTLATELCFLWTHFYNKVNSFFIRFARLRELQKIAANIGTNQWHYLEWKKLVGHTLSGIDANFTIGSDGEAISNPDGEAPFFVAISNGLYESLDSYNLTGCFEKNPRLFKIDREYMYVRWIGLKSEVLNDGSENPCNIDEYVPSDIADNDNIEYVIYVDEREVEYGTDWTVGVAHNIYAPVEYIPIDLHNYSTDGQLLTRARKEPAHLFRERLRLYHGPKANFSSFRAIYDVLEDIVPGSTIDFWDYNSHVNGDNDEPEGPIVDKEVGWLLGIPGRTEVGFSTYLGLQLYTQGYWEWVWGSDDAQLLQVKGRYPFFVRTKKWWFDPELLYAVTDRFKSAGTTPNYSINKEVVTWPLLLDVDTSDTMSAFPDNLFQNPDMSDGAFGVIGQPVGGSISIWDCSVDASMSLEHVETDTTSEYAAKLVNSSSTDDLTFTQQLTNISAGDYHGQFLVRPDANITYNGGGNDFGTDLVLYDDAGLVTNIYVEPYGSSADWYLVKFWFTAGSDIDVLNFGIAIDGTGGGGDREAAVTDTWMIQETIIDSTPDARGDNVHPVRVSQSLSINFGVYTKRIEVPLYVTFSVE